MDCSTIINWVFVTLFFSRLSLSILQGPALRAERLLFFFIGPGPRDFFVLDRRQHRLEKQGPCPGLTQGRVCRRSCCR